MVPMTPEGKVKKQVKELLDMYAPDLYHHWPVQNGMGAPTLDCVATYQGRYFAIETKAPGKKMTARQENTAARIRDAGGKVFVIDGPIAMLSLRKWLEKIAPTGAGANKDGVSG